MAERASWRCCGCGRPGRERTCDCITDLVHDANDSSRVEYKLHTPKNEKERMQMKVITLMLASSCFGREVCPFPPCACAQSLIDAVRRTVGQAEQNVSGEVK
jgi:hypothetical protein